MESAGEGVQSAGGLAGGEVVAAVDAEDIGDARAAVAVAAAGGDLVGALRAIVVIAFDVGSAGRAAGGDGLAEQEIEHGSDAAGHETQTIQRRVLIPRRGASLLM